jgi:hypothetical protein
MNSLDSIALKIRPSTLPLRPLSFELLDGGIGPLL